MVEPNEEGVNTSNPQGETLGVIDHTLTLRDGDLSVDDMGQRLDEITSPQSNNKPTYATPKKGMDLDQKAQAGSSSKVHNELKWPEAHGRYT